MIKALRSFRGGYVVFLLFGLALVLRSWSLTLVLTLGLYVFWRSRVEQKKEKRPKLTEEEKEAIITGWEPAPLVPRNASEAEMTPRLIDQKMLKFVHIDGKQYLNLASSDFLSFIGNGRIEEVARKTISKYGVGACGPRNFYGTVDVHLDLERQLAQFLGCEEAILYSYGFATVSSAIPAYSKPGDILFVDKAVNFAIQKGLQASKSQIIWFNHNDMNHLEALLEEQDKRDKKNPKKAANIRRLIVVEGLYAKTANICPLPRLVELKWRHKVRILVDESFSFGVLGRQGKGVTEHFGVDVIDVDLIVASLENALATTGGFCAGRSYVIGHQRLSGLGYCFSASLPPLLATAASEALDIIKESPEIIGQLRANSIQLHRVIGAATEATKFKLIGADISPLKHIAYEHEDRNVAEGKLNSLVQKLDDDGIFVTRARFLDEEEAFLPQPTIKVMCRLDLTAVEIESIGQKLQLALTKLGKE